MCQYILIRHVEVTKSFRTSKGCGFTPAEQLWSIWLIERHRRLWALEVFTFEECYFWTFCSSKVSGQSLAATNHLLWFSVLTESSVLIIAVSGCEQVNLKPKEFHIQIHEGCVKMRDDDQAMPFTPSIWRISILQWSGERPAAPGQLPAT